MKFNINPWFMQKKKVPCCLKPNIQEGTKIYLHDLLVNKIFDKYDITNKATIQEGWTTKSVITFCDADNDYYNYIFRNISYTPKICLNCKRVFDEITFSKELKEFDDWLEKEFNEKITKYHKNVMAKKVDQVLKEREETK